MVKRVFIAAVIMIGMLGAADRAPAAGIGFRLNGGACYIIYRDYNDYVDDFNAQLMPYTNSRLDNLQWGMEFGAEGFKTLIPAIDIAIGVGIMAGASDFSFAAEDESQNFEHRAKSYPITATVYARFPVALGPIKPFVFAGGGAYPTKITFDYSVSSGTESFSYEAELSKTGFGFHGGAGIAIGIMPNMGIEFSVRGRYAKITGFEGTATNSEGETIDVFIAKSTTVDGFHVFGIRDVTDDEDSEEASVDLSGCALMLSLAYSF